MSTKLLVSTDGLISFYQEDDKVVARSTCCTAAVHWTSPAEKGEWICSGCTKQLIVIAELGASYCYFFEKGRDALLLWLVRWSGYTEDQLTVTID